MNFLAKLGFVLVLIASRRTLSRAREEAQAQ
jgi:hypothetical protein